MTQPEREVAGLVAKKDDVVGEITSKALSEVSAAELAKIPFLSVATSRGLGRLAQKTRLQKYTAGAVIFNEGDPPFELFVVRSGEVRISMSTPEGGREDRRTLGSGRLLGELGILGGHPRTATAEAIEDSELWAIDREAFLEMYQSEPAVAIEVASALAPYLLDSDLVAEDLLFLDLPGRIAKRLLSYSDARGKNVHAVVASETMSVDQVAGALRNIAQGRDESQTRAQLFKDVDTLAMMAGGTRDATARVLVEMERRGLILNTEGNIILVNPAGLLQMVRP